ncbi:hypothetical protein ABW20_dc0110178 [Dactylellina cionopaga]|nr:hypothetical protein ABW20_dc0110178 [Dactylellina cionopaga]
MGGVACVASVFRLLAILEYSDYSVKSNSVLVINAWTWIELNIALICAAAPSIRALVIFFAPKILSAIETVANKDEDGEDNEKSVSDTKVTPAKTED